MRVVMNEIAGFDQGQAESATRSQPVQSQYSNPIASWISRYEVRFVLAHSTGKD